MKYLKKFDKMFESGIPEEQFKEIKSAIINLIEKDYSPNISKIPAAVSRVLFPDQPKIFHTGVAIDGDTRKFTLNISGNDSKWGRILEVAFMLEYGVIYDEVNDNFKQLEFPYKIGDIISDFTNKGVSLYGFDFFGNKVMGKKDGRALEVENVYDKFRDVIEKLEETPYFIYKGYSPMIFWFLLR